MAAEALVVAGLNQYYGGSHILRELSFELPAGKVTTLLGRNGVGKTTLLRTLMGLVPSRTGTIRFGVTPTIGPLGATHEQGVPLGTEPPLEVGQERDRLRREDVVRPHASDSSNCCSSVEPVSARVEDAPPETTCITSSKYPAPTSRWWRVAV